MRRAVPQGGSPNELQPWQAKSPHCGSRMPKQALRGDKSFKLMAVHQTHALLYGNTSLPVLLPLFLAAVFPHCHHSFSPYHFSQTLFSFICTSTFSFYSSSLLLVCLASVRLKEAEKEDVDAFVDSSKSAEHKCSLSIIKDHAFVSLVLCASASPPPQPTRERPFERQGADSENGCIVLVFITQQYSCKW